MNPPLFSVLTCPGLQRAVHRAFVGDLQQLGALILGQRPPA
jgi:hypothetical protein